MGKHLSERHYQESIAHKAYPNAICGYGIVQTTVWP